jgi:hypothetical protein
LTFNDRFGDKFPRLDDDMFDALPPPCVRNMDLTVGRLNDGGVTVLPWFIL